MKWEAGISRCKPPRTGRIKKATELHSISYDKSSWERILSKVHMDTHTHNLHCWVPAWFREPQSLWLGAGGTVRVDSWSGGLKREWPTSADASLFPLTTWWGRWKPRRETHCGVGRSRRGSKTWVEPETLLSAARKALRKAGSPPSFRGVNLTLNRTPSALRTEL